MDDGFVLILAIIVFSVFRNFITEAKKKGVKPDDPDSFDTSAEHGEAQDRALDALRQWEAKQRAIQAGSGDPAPRRTQQPAVRRGARPFEPAEPTGAEQARREAYNAIRDLLSGKTQRPSLPVQKQPDQGSVLARRREQAPSQVPAQRPSAAPARTRDRTPALRARSRIQGTIRRQDEPEESVLQPREDRRDQDRAVPARLDRLDSLPPVARGIVYAELLGKPVAFREAREGGGGGGGD